MKLKYFVLFAFIFMSFKVVGFSQAKAEKCVIEAWIEDAEIPKIDDRLRSRPRYVSRSLLEIPFAFEDDEKVALEITGVSNDYLRVRRAFNAKRKINFRGIGWIFSRRVSFVVNTADGKDAKVFELPKLESKSVGTIPNGKRVDFAIEDFDCFGFKIEWEGIKGWLPKADICGNLKTCL